MKELYCNAENPLPLNMPKPRDKPVNINAIVDSDYTCNVVTCQYHTIIMILINMAPIQWYNKKQMLLKVQHLVLNS